MQKCYVLIRDKACKVGCRGCVAGIKGCRITAQQCTVFEFLMEDSTSLQQPVMIITMHKGQQT